MDTVDRESRSRMMAAVKGKHTQPEMAVRKAAHRLGLRFRLHAKRLPGRPDLVFPRWRTVVFVNGCFWHRHTGCPRATTPKTNLDFWERKFSDNVRRDTANHTDLERLGWRVVTIWECECRTIEDASRAVAAHFTMPSENAADATPET